MVKSILALFLIIIVHSGFANTGFVNVAVKTNQIPILKERDTNPIFRIEIEPESTTKLKSIDLNFDGSSDLIDFQSFSVFYSGTDSVFRSNKPIAILSDIKLISRLKLDLSLEKRKVYVWVSCRLHSQANLLNQLNVRIDQLEFSNSQMRLRSNHNFGNFRYGLALRSHGQEGIHTHRIPGLATSEKGTLLAIYDARRYRSRDLQGDIDIGLNRSIDGGNTWQPLQVIMDMNKWGGLPEKYNGVSDACILVNGSDIYVAGLWMHGVINKEGEWLKGLDEEADVWNHQWRNRGSQPGFEPDQTSQFLLVKSSDDGKTWDKPINLTKMCKKEEWWLWAPAPGRGIVMKDGTLVFPTQGRDKNGLPFSNITYSVENGDTWTTSNPASHNTTENSVVEYENGKLMLNIRDNRNRQDKSSSNGRAVFTTSNLGNTWLEHNTSHNLLIEPVCMASLHKHVYSTTGGKKEVLLFSNPHSKYQRIKQTIKMSFDDGETWPEDNWILLDEGKGRGYSCITTIDQHTIGIVYEGSRSDLIFQKIDLSEYLKIH